MKTQLMVMIERESKEEEILKWINYADKMLRCHRGANVFKRINANYELNIGVEKIHDQVSEQTSPQHIFP